MGADLFIFRHTILSLCMYKERLYTLMFSVIIRNIRDPCIVAYSGGCWLNADRSEKQRMCLLHAKFQL